MYLHQEILEHGIIPVLEPVELVSFSMVSKLFCDIVNQHISNTVIKRMNDMLIQFFGMGIDKIKEFMNNTGAFLAREVVLQCILDEYWVCKSTWYVNNIHFYYEIIDPEDEYNIYFELLGIVEELGFKIVTSYTANMYIFVNTSKQYVYISFVRCGYDSCWLNNFRSKYYMRDNFEKVEILPSYNSLIRKIVKYDAKK